MIDAKYQGDTAENSQNVQRAKEQMNIMLGNNTWGKDGNPLCLVTGFSKYSPQRPHFRASSGETFDMKVKDDTTIIDSYDDKYVLIGGIIGGPKADGTYKNNAGNYVSYDDKRSEYSVNEVASDYNSVLASAAAGLYYFYKTGSTCDIPDVKNSYNGKPKTEESTLTLQSLSSELPMLFMAQAKQVRSAGEDSNGNYESIESPEFKASIDIPNLNGDLKSITVIFTSNITDYISIEYQNETGGYMGSGGEYKSNTDTFSFSKIAAGCKKIKIGCNGNTSYDIKEIRFYYEPDNTFKVTPSTCDLPINEKVTLTANAPAEWTADTGNVQIVPKSDDKKSCVVKALSGANESVTITAERAANSSQTALATINIKPKNQWYTVVQNTPIEAFELTGDWENVTSIELIYEGSGNFGCGLTINSNKEKWYQTNGHTENPQQKNFDDLKNETFEPMDITSLKFRLVNWGSNCTIKEIRLHYVDVPKYTITSDKTELLPGETAVLTVKDADGNKINGINWTIPEGCGTIESNNDGTYIYTAGGHFGEKELTGEANGIKGKITLTTKTITANSPIKLRTGKTDVITLTGADNAEISYNVGDSSVASVDENGSVTANSIGETTVVIVCNGTETDCQVNIQVLDELTSSSKAVTMKPNSTVQLKVSNAVGNVTWSIEDNNFGVTVDPATGLVTS